MTAVLRLHSYWYRVGITQPQTSQGLRSDPEEQGLVWNENRLGLVGGTHHINISRYQVREQQSPGM